MEKLVCEDKYMVTDDIKNDIKNKYQKVWLDFFYFEKDKTKLPRVIAYKKNYIIDQLVSEDIIPNQGWDCIGGITDSFFIDEENPRIEVHIRGILR